MTLNERLREAFDKRVCGTAMLPASDLLSAMTAIEQAEAENAALKEQITHLKSSVQHEADCVDSAAEEINRQSAENDKFKETIAQQADVIEQMREALRHYAYRAGQDWQIAREAIALQPSPEIIEVRDDRVADACAKYLSNERIALANAYKKQLCAEIRSGEWRKYL